jgi:AraC-like DNA-binding protein
MVTLVKGKFFGQTNETTSLNGVTLTDTEYTHEKVDWHYHENAYFTLILEGKVIEGNKKEIYHCPPGTLLFHNWQEAHYNVKPNGFTRGFHIEIEPAWFKTHEVDLDLSQGSINLSHPKIKIQAYTIFKESKINDDTSHLAIHSLLIDVLSRIDTKQEKRHHKIPDWVFILREILNDSLSENRTLTSLAKTAGIHPMHLSRDFSKYFHCNLGDYIRSIKIQRALSLLLNRNLSLTDIAYECGFSDQSHFIRCFKAINHLKPSQLRRILLK